MCNIQIVQIIKPQQNLIYNSTDISFPEIINPCQSFKKFTTFNNFWNNIIILLILNYFNNLNQVWMITGWKYCQLFQKKVRVVLSCMFV